MIRKLIPLTVILFTSTIAYSQLIVTNDLTPEEYVQTVLLDENGGVTASNITFNGQPGNEINNQCGGFVGVNTIIELCDGVILASGGVTGAVGPNNSGGLTQDIDVSVVGDADLEDLLPGFAMNDVSSLEFDFVPIGDTLRFNYIFGSEEYLEWVGSSFNDVFGFFLCGPGISGPFSTPDDAIYPNGSTNLAIIEGTGDPVSINNVNDVNNSDFYVENGDGIDEPWFSDDFYIQYDGLTVTLTALAALIPGETYHIKMAVADAGDTALDSGVFLEGGSFSTGFAGLEAVLPNPIAGLIENSTVCDTGYFLISREECILDSVWYHFEYSGTAVSGQDYEPLPVDTFMVEDQTTLTYPMYAIQDGVTEGTEVIEVLVFTSDTNEPGSFVFQDTLFIDIVDNYTYPLDMTNVYVECPTDSADVIVSALPIGVGPFEYFWSATVDGDIIGNNIQQTVVLPPEIWDTQDYYAYTIDFCGMKSIVDTATITNAIEPSPIVEINLQNPYCIGVDYPIFSQVQFGAADFNYAWSGSDGSSNSGPNAAWTIPNIMEETEFYLRVTDKCGRIADDTVSVAPAPPLEATRDVPQYICLDEVMSLDALASGGILPYYYYWTMNPNFGFILEENINNGEAYIENLYKPSEDENDVLINLEVKDYCQDLRDELNISQFDETVEFEDEVTLLDCIVPNVVSANGDDMNDFFVADELLARRGTMSIYNRWGKLMKETSLHFWDPDKSPDGTYFYVILFENEEIRKGSFTVLR